VRELPPLDRVMVSVTSFGGSKGDCLYKVLTFDCASSALW
jgi:hypothetical protein